MKLMEGRQEDERSKVLHDWKSHHVLREPDTHVRLNITITIVINIFG
jgi:hypothetical protein